MLSRSQENSGFGGSNQCVLYNWNVHDEAGQQNAIKQLEKQDG
jgi:hypothetical protein